MTESAPSPPHLQVALLEPEPIRLQGFMSIFSGHPRIELMAVDLAQLLADRGFALALIGLYDDRVQAAMLGAIRSLRPNLRLIVMGANSGDEAVLSAIAAGAKAYLDVAATPEQVAQAIEAVSQGSIWAPRRVLSLFVDRATRSAAQAHPPAPVSFTAREAEVLELLVAAGSNREIARILGIQERTVKAHVAKLMRKVGVENRIALSVHAVTHSMVAKGDDRADVP